MAINLEALSLIHPDLGVAAEAFLPDTAHVLRTTVTAPAPVSNLDFGYGSPAGESSVSSEGTAPEVDSLRCALVEFRTSEGKQSVIVDAVETIVPWLVKFRATPELDVRVGDTLEIKGRRFKVIIAPRIGSFNVLCSANCQEIE
jgi:hypothetical protein